MTFVMYRDAAQQWRWYLLAGNNRKVADSGEGYINKDDCRAIINNIKMSVPGAQVTER